MQVRARDTRRATPAGMERRTDPRFALRTPGLVAGTVGVYDCVVADISLGGCMLEGRLPLRHGEEIAIGFDTLMGLLGNVAHAGDDFIGVRFQESAVRRDEIRNWMVARLKIARAAGAGRP